MVDEIIIIIIIYIYIYAWSSYIARLEPIHNFEHNRVAKALSIIGKNLPV